VADGGAPVTADPAAPAPSTGDAVALRPRVVVSWALYDLANTIYSAIVMTTFLPDLLDVRYGTTTPFFVATSVTLLLSAFVSTSFGAHVDRTGRARPGLDVATLVCAGATAGLWLAAGAGVPTLLVLYAVSLFAYQAALTFYNALLPVVAPPERRGFVSGLGTGLGYAGLPLAFLVGKAVVSSPMGTEGTFLLCAALLTLGTVPLWLFVRDDPRAVRAEAAPRVRLVDSLRWVASHRLLGLLLLANFVNADVANTLITHVYLYLKKHVGLAAGDAVNLMVALSLTALAGGLVVGRLADRLRPARVLAACAGALMSALLVTAAWPRAWPSVAWLVVAGGLGIAATWTIGRQLVIRVAPRERCGEALGLYGVTTKASILGTSVFALLRDALGYPVAVVVQACVLGVGIVLLLAFDRRAASEAA
jgi:MFS transporter, UMF1 family